MGDRANLIINVQAKVYKSLANMLNGSVVLYGHWMGRNMAPKLEEALHQAKGRFNDPSYFSRIIISQMVGDDWNEETGFGISVGEIMDNENNILVIDQPEKMLHVYPFWTDVLGMTNYPIRSMSFDTFMSLSEEALRSFHHGEQQSEF